MVPISLDRNNLRNPEHLFLANTFCGFALNKHTISIYYTTTSLDREVSRFLGLHGLLIGPQAEKSWVTPLPNSIQLKLIEYYPNQSPFS